MRNVNNIAELLKRECDTAFGVTGGCIVNMVDALHKAKFNIIPMHHEQCAAMAADAYARMKNSLGLCFATSGPGGQNLLTGLACSYYDSIPVMALIGQVPRGHYIKTRDKYNVRQYGFQESPNALMAKFVTKYSMTSTNVNICKIAIENAMCGRRGPVVLELCDDEQRNSDSNGYFSFSDIEMVKYYMEDEFCLSFEKAIESSKRPVLILGNGVSSYREKALKFVNSLKIPTLLTWGAKDILPKYHKYNVGTFGITGTRLGNFVLKNSDLIICIGSRLDTHNIGTGDYSWLKDKKIFVVDCDEKEIKKLTKEISPDIKYCISTADKIFKNRKLNQINCQINFDGWMNRINKARPLCDENYKKNDNDFTCPYWVISTISEFAGNNAIIIPDAGQSLVWGFQSWKIKPGQRIFTDYNNSCMGYSIPAAIGAAIACPNRPVYVIIGDGSLMMNLQELQTIAHHKLNIKIFIMNNGGYGMIRQTQNDWDTLDKGPGCDKKHGLSFPDFELVAKSFKIKYTNIKSFKDIKTVIDSKSPVISEIFVNSKSKIYPKLLYGDALWNLKPYLAEDKIDQIEKILVGE